MDITDDETFRDILVQRKQLWPADKAREETTPGGEGDAVPSGSEITFNVDGGDAIVRTEHSHEEGREIRENLLKPGEEGWNKWLGNCYESWIEIDFKDA